MRLDAVSSAFKAKSGVELKVSYAGSMTLAKQIESGAPADVFTPRTKRRWTNLSGKSLILAGTRTNLLGNVLVVVAPKTSNWRNCPSPRKPFPPPSAPARLRQAIRLRSRSENMQRRRLEKYGLCPRETEFAFTDNVRAALMFVAREEAALSGSYYVTDAKSEPKVRSLRPSPAEVSCIRQSPIRSPLPSVGAGRGAEETAFLLEKQSRRKTSSPNKDLRRPLSARSQSFIVTIYTSPTEGFRLKTSRNSNHWKRRSPGALCLLLSRPLLLRLSPKTILRPPLSRTKTESAALKGKQSDATRGEAKADQKGVAAKGDGATRATGQGRRCQQGRRRQARRGEGRRGEGHAVKGAAAKPGDAKPEEKKSYYVPTRG